LKVVILIYDIYNKSMIASGTGPYTFRRPTVFYLLADHSGSDHTELAILNKSCKQTFYFCPQWWSGSI